MVQGSMHQNVEDVEDDEREVLLRNPGWGNGAWPPSLAARADTAHARQCR